MHDELEVVSYMYVSLFTSADAESQIYLVSDPLDPRHRDRAISRAGLDIILPVLVT